MNAYHPTEIWKSDSFCNSVTAYEQEAADLEEKDAKCLASIRALIKNDRAIFDKVRITYIAA